MKAFDVVGDPVRRRILEQLALGEVAAAEVVALVGAEFGLSQPAVSQHLKVLRESGFAVVRAEGTRRLYSLDATPLRAVGDWVAGVLASQPAASPQSASSPRAWQSLDALATEVARGRRARRTTPAPSRSVPEEPEEKIS